MTVPRLTSPSQAITAELLHRESSMAVSEIADRLSMSSSMVRHRLPEVRRWVQSAGGELVNSDSGRLELAFNEDDRPRAEQLLSTSGLFLTGAERRALILARLLLASGDVQTDELAAIFDVSRTTLFADLRVLRAEVRTIVTLEGISGKGIRAIADELPRRRLLVATLASVIGDDWPWHLKDEPRLALLPEIQESVVPDIAERILNARSGSALMKDGESQDDLLVGYVVIALSRYISEPLQGVDGDSDLSLLSEVALESARSLWRHVTGSGPLVGELAALAQYIAVAECLLPPGAEVIVSTLNAELTAFLADTLSAEVVRQPTFARALEQHIRASLPRLIHGIELNLSQRTELQAAYPYAHALAERALTLVEAHVDVSAPDSETTSFAMLIAAFTENAEAPLRTRHRVVVVCNTGRATALLLRERILRTMPDIDIVAVLSHSAMMRSPALLHSVDLILTTAILAPAYPAPVVRVSPLLTAQDKVAIDRAVTQRHPRKATKKGSEYISMNDFTSSFDSKACAIGVHADNWQDAMRQAGSLLVQAGAVDESYVQATIDSVHRYGPYIVMAPGVALPHANNEKNVHRTCFGLMTLSTPVAFKGPERTEMVDVLIPMAAADGKDHVGILAGLARSLQTDSFVVDIRAAEDSDEALAVLRTHLTGGNA